MQIIKTNAPTQSIIHDIKRIEQACKEHDGLRGSVSLDYSLNIHLRDGNVIKVLRQEEPVSFLSLFVPGGEEAEVSACTLPGHRRKGYFGLLLVEAGREAAEYGIRDLLFVCEAQSRDGKSALAALCAEYRFTEYALKYLGQAKGLESPRTSWIRLREADREDLEAVIAMSQAIFHDNPDEPLNQRTGCNISPFWTTSRSAWPRFSLRRAKPGSSGWGSCRAIRERVWAGICWTS